MKQTAVVAGAGGALGAALCRELKARGWHVVAMGRARARLETELAGSAHQIVEANLAAGPEVAAAFANIPAADAMIYNAGRLELASLEQTTPEMYSASWEVNAFGAFLCAKAAAPAMAARGHGGMAFMGATASTRGGARTHAFASAKYALRGLAQSLAKELGPRGVHVAHLVMDGKIWGARTRERFEGVAQAQCIAPDAAAAAVCGLLEQPPSAWTFEMDLRPSGEKWR